MSHTRELDFGEVEPELSEDDKLESVAGLIPASLDTLKAPTPTEEAITAVLDFWGPWGLARQCWYALRVLETGRLGVDDEEGFDVVAARVRRQCREMISSGRVKAAGQPRQRHAKPAPAGQGDLF